MEMKFYRCRHCGNIIAYLKESGVKVICCGEEMGLMTPNTVDASAEKHVPVLDISGDTVTVHIGSAAHPMVNEHYIEWICLQTREGNQRKLLFPGDKPQASFKICPGDAVEAAYEYCNLHGLWKVEA